MVESAVSSGGLKPRPWHAWEPGPKVQESCPTKYFLVVALNPSESERKVWNVPASSGDSMMTVTSLGGARPNRNQSADEATPNGNCSNASAGLKNKRDGSCVGNGPGPVRLMRRGVVTFGK